VKLVSTAHDKLSVPPLHSSGSHAGGTEKTLQLKCSCVLRTTYANEGSSTAFLKSLCS
jgi:hypothetical protein